ncbi:hypothetical protein [Leifsonia sp. Leaf264]|uniref:hypothetical protein n=1 Tax=Leifsonia sp. Leaf264 TaxID=1736314 RepID=UPI0006F23CFF|nr:hypothetical protein [Leifsonia sp. Leaf264]KQP01380.1 hypothetical protein ASF30_01830 [Leifsonia sp. Leaf264]
MPAEHCSPIYAILVSNASTVVGDELLLRSRFESADAANTYAAGIGLSPGIGWAIVSDRGDGHGFRSLDGRLTPVEILRAW